MKRCEVRGKEGKIRKIQKLLQTQKAEEDLLDG